MGKITVSIPLITWRDGRPRFSPGPRLRKPPFSMKGEDLRNPDGRWFGLEEAAAWSDRRQALIAQVEAAASPRQARRIASTGTSHATIGQLSDAWFREPRMNGTDEVQGKKVRKALSPNTVDGYKQGMRTIEQFDGGRIWAAPAAAITSSILGNEERGVFHKIEVRHGLSTARKARSALSSFFAWCIANGRGGITFNPVAKSTRLPTPEPRVRYGTVAEMKHLAAAAERLGRPELALSILLGLWTGQRQNDRLSLADGQVTADGILVRQLKKGGQPLLIPPSPELKAAIAATKHRRRDWKVNYHELVLDEKNRRPFQRSHYTHTFARVRDFAATGTGTHELTGEAVTIPKLESLADFHDQDLRDTAVTWLALAGCTVPQIASITGHSLKTVESVLKHYLGMHPELARSAITRLVAWHEEQGEGK